MMDLSIKMQMQETSKDMILLYVLQDTASASSQLAVSVIQTCTEKLEPLVCAFLTSCILDRDAVESELKEFYHEIIFRIFECAPQMLLAVIPNLTQELLVCSLVFVLLFFSVHLGSFSFAVVLSP